MNQTVAIFKALSDKNRLRILKMLQFRPMCVCEIKDVLALANSTTSKHLSILKSVDLIFEKRDGKWINYYLNQTIQKKHAKEILVLLEKWLEDDLLIEEDRQKVMTVNRSESCNG